MIDISIIITTFNYGEYICECIRSCLIQKENNLRVEIIIIDDGSIDNTEELINEFFETQVKYFKINNSGIEKASNYGFQLSKGKYFVRVDADDKLSFNFLYEVSKYLNNNYDFIYSNYSKIDKNGNFMKEIILPPFSKSEIFQRGDFLASGTLYKSSLLKKYGGYNTKTKNCGLENYEFIIKLISLGYVGFRIPKLLFFYRIHGKNLSSSKIIKIGEYGQNIFNKYNLGKYTKNQFHPYAQY